MFILQQIRDDIKQLRTEFVQMRTDFANDIKQLRTEFVNLSIEFGVMKQDIIILKYDLFIRNKEYKKF